MPDNLLSVGLDVGTTSTQMIFSELAIENRASSFAVPEMQIADRKILYKSPVHFTPLLDENRMDAQALRVLVEEEYRRAGIRREQVDTGALIITGETSRKENARAVLEAISDFAGEFVVATAGPDLESVLAARGAGAVDYSAETGKTVLHMDIGGGTSNLAWIEDGKIVRTGCLNVGGRLLKFDEQGTVLYVSPVLAGICDLQVGSGASRQQVEAVAQVLVQALEMAAGLREETPLLEKMKTKEIAAPLCPPVRDDSGFREDVLISFSGGVADCIRQEYPWLRFGDMGPVLGQAIRNSRLCQRAYILGKETIRATVIGAGCHSTQLSGSTVFYQNIEFPLKNLPVIRLEESQQQSPERAIRAGLERQEGTAVVAMPGFSAPGYTQVVSLAESILRGCGGKEIYLCLQQDMAKALGQALAVRMGKDAKILCIDRVKLEEGSYLDVGAPVGPALPVVVKTLILAGDKRRAE